MFEKTGWEKYLDQKRRNKEEEVRENFIQKICIICIPCYMILS
jgi:hypothetical protein